MSPMNAARLLRLNQVNAHARIGYGSKHTVDGLAKSDKPPNGWLKIETLSGWRLTYPSEKY